MKSLEFASRNLGKSLTFRGQFGNYTVFPTMVNHTARNVVVVVRSLNKDLDGTIWVLSGSMLDRLTV